MAVLNYGGLYSRYSQRTDPNRPWNSLDHAAIVAREFGDRWTGRELTLEYAAIVAECGMNRKIQKSSHDVEI